MVYKTIERPKSTTVVDEAMFHQCRGEVETRNALAGVSPNEIVIWKKTLRERDFVPEVWLIIQKDGLPLSQCMKYICEYRFTGL